MGFLIIIYVYNFFISKKIIDIKKYRSIILTKAYIGVIIVDDILDYSYMKKYLKSYVNMAINKSLFEY